LVSLEISNHYILKYCGISKVCQGQIAVRREYLTLRFNKHILIGYKF